MTAAQGASIRISTCPQVRSGWRVALPPRPPGTQKTPASRVETTAPFPAFPLEVGAGLSRVLGRVWGAFGMAGVRVGNVVKQPQGAILRVYDKGVMPMEQFLLAVLAGVLVALIVHWLGLNK